MQFLDYGQTELDYLKGRDGQLAAVIDRVGMIRRAVTPDLFVALAGSIVGQQISPRAAETVWNRVVEKLGEVTPRTVAMASVDDLRSCGLSGRKVGYIQGIGQAVTQGVLDLNALAKLPDDEVIRQLSALPGVGVWTVEMLLIFSMRRPDVVSFGDFAIRRGLMRVYGLETLSKERFMQIRQQYSPYGTVASLYLWAAAHGE